MMKDAMKGPMPLEEPGTSASPEGLEERSDERPAGEAASPVLPDPETPEKPHRRRFGADYKLRILEEADGCEAPGAVGRLLRREGLYSLAPGLLAQGAAPGFVGGAFEAPWAEGQAR